MVFLLDNTNKSAIAHQPAGDRMNNANSSFGQENNAEPIDLSSHNIEDGVKAPFNTDEPDVGPLDLSVRPAQANLLEIQSEESAAPLNSIHLPQQQQQRQPLQLTHLELHIRSIQMLIWSIHYHVQLRQLAEYCSGLLSTISPPPAAQHVEVSTSNLLSSSRLPLHSLSGGSYDETHCTTETSAPGTASASDVSSTENRASSSSIRSTNFSPTIP